jgi:predicted exporter
MYAFVWRHLPGPWPVRLIIAAAMFLAVTAVLFLWVFPWLLPQLPVQDVTVESRTDSGG